MKASDWLRQACATLPTAACPAALLDGAASMLVLAPHPDDESLGCGALIAACAAEGRSVHVVVVSDGRFSHPHSRSHPAERLVSLRAAETRAAAAALGLDPERDLTFLGLPDRSVPRSGPGLAAACDGIRHVLPAAPDVVLAPWQHDPHADHAATAAMAQALLEGWPAARLLSYIVWGWAFLEPVPGFVLEAEPCPAEPPCGWRFAAAPWLGAKRRAIAAHQSQFGGVIGDDPDGFRLTPEALAPHLQPVEIYLA